MSVLLAGGVAAAYVAGVVGLHRLNVWRMRNAAGGFRTLHWLDWDSLLEGLLPDLSDAPAVHQPQAVVGGGPVPKVLLHASSEEGRARREALCALVEGAVLGEAQLHRAGFTGGEVRWLKTLGCLVSDPDRALARLEKSELATVGEFYLREHLHLVRDTHAFNLELAVFASKRRLTHALSRYGEHPALFYVRALASSLLGFNHAAIDDLARAVYFSRQAPFYLQAVLHSPFIEDARPALFQQCRSASD